MLGGCSIVASFYVVTVQSDGADSHLFFDIRSQGAVYSRGVAQDKTSFFEVVSRSRALDQCHGVLI